VQPVQVGALRLVVEAVKERRVERHLEAAQLARPRLHARRGGEVDRRRLHELDAPARRGDGTRRLRALAARAGSGHGVRAQVEAEHLVPEVGG